MYLLVRKRRGCGKQKTKIVTYLGSTTRPQIRPDEHNSKRSGGARYTRNNGPKSDGGRPWAYACLLRGFKKTMYIRSFEKKLKITGRHAVRLTHKTRHLTSAATQKCPPAKQCGPIVVEWFPAAREFDLVPAAAAILFISF